MNKTKVLFLAANPLDTTRLRLDEEIRLITAKIRLSDYRDSIELISAWAIRADDLLQLLNEHKPHVVHFSGHGTSSGEITLLDNSGLAKPITSLALMSLFKTLKDNIRIVILNACFSQPIAEAITKTVDCAIGMNMPIGDPAAIIFAASFYRAIGFGRSANEAFEQGKLALLLEGLSEEKTPELICKKGIDPSHVFLIEEGINLHANTSKLPLYDTDALFKKFKKRLVLSRKEEVTLLLAGPTGIGKTSTINALMGRIIERPGEWKQFGETISMTSYETLDVKFTFIETYGLHDTIFSRQESNYKELLTAVPFFDCLLFFRSWNARSMLIDTCAVDILTESLGTEIWKRTIAVFTHVPPNTTLSSYKEELELNTRLFERAVTKVIGEDKALPISSIGIQTKSRTTPDGRDWLEQLYEVILSRVLP